MSKRNYTNYAKKFDEKPVEQEVVDTVVEPVEAEPAETETVVTLYGIVSGCNSLNIRKEPNRDADVLCVENLKSVLVVDLNTSADEWYAVCTKEGIEGFCMKQYVTLGK